MSLEVRQGAQLNQIGAKVSGEEVLLVTGGVMVNVVVVGTLEVVVVLGETLVGEVALVGVEDLLFLWYTMSTGCVAI